MIRTKKPIHILAAAIIALTLLSSGRFSYSVFIGPLVEDFGWTTAQAALPFALSMLFWGFAQPVIGTLADRYGARKMIIVGALFMSTGFLVSAAAANLWHISLGYGVFIGLATAGAGQLTFSLLVAKWFDKKRRGLAVGASVAASPFSSLISAPIFFWVSTNFTWRYAFAGVGLIILAVALPLILMNLREPRPGEEAGWQDDGSAPKGREAAKAGGKTNGQATPPIMETLRQFRKPPLRNLLLSYSGCGFTGFFLSAHLAALTREYQFHPAYGAFAVSMLGLVSIGGSLVGGILSDRYGRPQVLAGTYFIRAAGALFLAYLVFNVPTYYLGAILSGLPLFATISITNTLNYELSGPRQAGLSMGMIFLVHQIGATAGPYLGGLAYDLTGSYRIVLTFGAAWLLLAGFLSLRIGHHMRAGRQTLEPNTRMIEKPA